MDNKKSCKREIIEVSRERKIKVGFLFQLFNQKCREKCERRLKKVEFMFDACLVKL